MRSGMRSSPFARAARPRVRPRHSIKSSRILGQMLRALMALYALAALWFAGIWVLEVVDLFDPNFNEDRALGDELLIGQALVGCLGVLFTLVASGSGLAFARTTARRWLTWVGLITLCALPLLVFWLFFLAGPAGSR